MSNPSNNEFPIWNSKILPPETAAYDSEAHKEFIQEMAKTLVDNSGWLLASVSPVLDEEMLNHNKLIEGTKNPITE